MQRCRRYYVSGHVQGVFFRDSTRRQAHILGLSGWARNLPDSRVEVLACGEDRALAAMERWLWEGPPLAEVTDVTGDDIQCDVPAGFTIG